MFVSDTHMFYRGPKNQLSQLFDASADSVSAQTVLQGLVHLRKQEHLD